MSIQSIWHSITGTVAGTWNNTVLTVESLPANLMGYQSAQQIAANKKALEDKAKSLAKSMDAKQAEITANDTALGKYKAAQQSCNSGTDPVQVDGHSTPCSVVNNQVSNLTSKKTRLDNEMKSLVNQYKDVEKQLGVVTSSATKGTTPAGNGNGSGNSGVTTTQLISKNDGWKGKYKYNAPMVKEAYFSHSTLQKNILDGNYVDQGNFNDAIKAWKENMGGRGVIQQDRTWLRTVINQPKQDPKLIKRLNNSYGFKFHYNPSSISQAWGVQSVADPVWLSQQDTLAIQPVTMNLSSAIVDFQIILNRIEDYKHLDKDGYLAGFTPSDFTKELGAAGSSEEHKRYLTRLAFERNAFEHEAIRNPYPTYVPLEDRADIVKRGTMYDIEYLFKTIMSPLQPFEGALNGVTSDRAYLQPAIVELHLGDALRYRARIEKFSINHIVFSPKMVPLFTTVSLSMSRFVDSPNTNATELTAFNTSGGGNTATGTAGFSTLQR